MAGTGAPPLLRSTSLCRSPLPRPLAAAEHAAGSRQGNTVRLAQPGCPTRARHPPLGTGTRRPGPPARHWGGAARDQDTLPLPTGVRTCHQQRLDQQRPPVHGPRPRLSRPLPDPAPLGPHRPHCPAARSRRVEGGEAGRGGAACPPAPGKGFPGSGAASAGTTPGPSPETRSAAQPGQPRVSPGLP